MKKENIPLIIGLAIPLIMVIILGAVIFLPRAYVSPEYDFVYAVGDYPTYINPQDKMIIEYRLEGSHLTRQDIAYTEEFHQLRTTEPRFYRYDVSESVNLPLSEEDVMQATLNPAQQSPDGFELDYASSRDNMFEAFFGGRDYSQRVLKRGSTVIELNLVSEGMEFDQGISFIGWVVE